MGCKKSVSEQSIVIADDIDTLGPNTPDTNRENGEVLDPESPLSLPEMSKVAARLVSLGENKDQQSSVCDDQSDSPCTPKYSVFDPFAPGREDLLLAPKCNKHADEWRSSVARRLNFDCSVSNLEDIIKVNDSSTPSDEQIVNWVYHSVLEVVLNHMEEVPADTSDLECRLTNCKMTPLMPRFNGIAETCPGAPVKPSMKGRNIYLGSCRKLEF